MTYIPSPFIQGLGLLIKLHAMMKAGNGDSEEADFLRDKMDPLWYTMTDEEQTLWEHASEALYLRDGM
jgi:hypothetical protein